MFFSPHKCPDTHTLIIGRSVRDHGIVDGSKVSELLHFLMATAMGPGSGEWYGRICDHQNPGREQDGVATDMLMIGDFGKDQDDEKALVMAVAMRRTGERSARLVAARPRRAACDRGVRPPHRATTAPRDNRRARQPRAQA